MVVRFFGGFLLLLVQFFGLCGVSWAVVYLVTLLHVSRSQVSSVHLTIWVIHPGQEDGQRDNPCDLRSGGGLESKALANLSTNATLFCHLARENIEDYGDLL